MSNSILEYRKKYGLTKVSLSKMLGVSCRTIDNWENGVSAPSVFYILMMREAGNSSGFNPKYCGFPWMLKPEARSKIEPILKGKESP